MLPGRLDDAPSTTHERGFCEASRRNRARHFPKRRGRNDFGNTTVEEFDRFLKTFSTKGALTRCRVTPRFAGASSAQWQAHRQRNTRITGARGRRGGLKMTFLGTGLGTGTRFFGEVQRASRKGCGGQKN